VAEKKSLNHQNVLNSVAIHQIVITHNVSVIIAIMELVLLVVNVAI